MILDENVIPMIQCAELIYPLQIFETTLAESIKLTIPHNITIILNRPYKNISPLKNEPFKLLPKNIIRINNEFFELTEWPIICFDTITCTNVKRGWMGSICCTHEEGSKVYIEPPLTPQILDEFDIIHDRPWTF